MTTILEEFINSIESSKLDEKMKIVCDKIMEEETKNFKFKEFHPIGVNIFLVMELESSQREMFFITLERESSETYVIKKYYRGFNRELKTIPTSEEKSEGMVITPPLKIMESIPLTQLKYDTSKKILTEYANKFKFEKGE